MATSHSETPIVEYALAGGETSFCEREPIHIPGAIQPHGALLAATIDGLRVSHASENLEAILGVTARRALGGPLAQAIGGAACRALQESGTNEGFEIGSTYRMDRPGGGALHLRLYRSARHFCVDIEPIPVDRAGEASAFASALSVLQTFSLARGPEELIDLAVRGVKAATGYDRVMAYRFDQDGHGEVIAEDREAQLEPYLGHHYPASDIPAQARRLYLRQRVGAIADSNYLPTSLLVDASLDDGAPLDLTHSALRSVSPIHRQYMCNMKTAASLTIGLAFGQDLWGMLVCHHQTPRIAGPDVRAVAGMVGQVVSLLLDSLGRAEVLAQRHEREAILRSLLDRLAAPASPPDALRAAEEELLGLVNAAGALVRSSGSSFRIGRVPPTTMAERTLAIMRASAGGHVLAVDDLPLQHPELADGAGEGSGALLLPLGMDPDDAIVWFRPEIVRNVVWAGNPADHATADPITGQISPRASFAAWKSKLRGRSAPWTDADLSLAAELGNAVAVEALRRARAAERESDARFRLLAEHSGDVIVLCDSEGTRLYVSPAAERVLGWRPDQMVGRNAMDFVHSEDQPALRDGITAIRAGGLEGVMYFRHLRPDGSWLWVEAHARVFASAGAEAANHRVVVLRDATATKAAERKLQDALKGMEEKAEASRRALAGERESEARFQLLAEHSGDVIALSDLHGVRSYVSPAAERVLGWRPDQMVGRGAMEFAHPADQHVLRNALAAMQGGESERSWCIRHLRPDGSWLWVEAHARVLAREDADAPNRYVAVLRDATATKAGERKLRDALAVMEQLAATDELTGLANRRLFGDAVTREWGRCARYGHPLSVLLLDADRFKDFNDRYGHLAGDECLRAIASQLSDAGRRTWDLAARYGGEEFVLLLPNTDHEGALQVARRVGELVKNLAIIHDGNTGHGVVTVSVGVATALPGSPASAFASVSAMLSAADAALYRAKNEGRNRVRDATGNG